MTIFVAASLAMLVLSPPPSLAEDDAGELMRRVYEQGRIHTSQRMDMEILIQDSRGRKRVRQFKMLYRIADGRTKNLLRFYKPSDIKGTGLFNIVYDQEDKETDQWIYFPAFRTVNKLGTEEKHQSFVGSDFTNSDIAGRKPDDDTHTFVRRDDTMSVVVSIPKHSTDPYSKIESHIINRINVPKKVEFYDRPGDLLKTLHSRKIAGIKGMYVIMRAEMENHRTGGSTVMTKQSVNFDTIQPSEVNMLRLQNR